MDIAPLAAISLKTLWLTGSAMKRLPEPSFAIPATAPKPGLGVDPLLMTVVMTPVVALISRTPCSPLSVTKMSPALSTAIPTGPINPALVAGPPSPEEVVAAPLPATVVMIPVVAFTFRTLLLGASAMYRFPTASNAIPAGVFNSALVAAPPSPEKPEVPLPATVVMIPVFAAILRTLLLKTSTMKILPALSVRTYPGEINFAPVALPPSPESPADPGVPAIVEMLFTCTNCATNGLHDTRSRSTIAKKCDGRNAFRRP